MCVRARKRARAFVMSVCVFVICMCVQVFMDLYAYMEVKGSLETWRAVHWTGPEPQSQAAEKLMPLGSVAYC